MYFSKKKTNCIIFVEYEHKLIIFIESISLERLTTLLLYKEQFLQLSTFNAIPRTNRGYKLMFDNRRVHIVMFGLRT